ncbi:hypothetical protein [Paenibacillus radicis (ex Xue et al. 2023)]|uniref:Phage protein n=1 Tax=Paenibacillus radicis (ex Xue et al. 2023) TaxID=2972489 RepID=A0ABT1YRF0_9BACL|nr:hypothetical protein [Paenibacillus radicis (ex Xue et al. 2023)]MCR8635764.1 hypothetical protein [Paenibacillus radicis (ex Xue et al. 2023)]
MMDMDFLFPEASTEDVKRAKTYLNQYMKKKKTVQLFEKTPPETEGNKELQVAAIKFTNLIERAVDQIIQNDVKLVIEYRFIKGNSRAATILKFSGWNCCDKTIDRKIDEGAESVANTLLYLE